MDLLALKTFKQVMDLGSITAAADQLNTVQPNVTARIRKLESELNTTLFNRAHRRLIPTPEADQLLDYANAMLALELAARTAVNPKENGDIRMGFVVTQATRWLPRFIQDYRQSFPGSSISVETGVSEALIKGVTECRLDAAVIVDQHAGPLMDHNLSSHALFTEELVLIAPASAGNLQEALDHPVMVLRQEGCGYRNFAVEWYNQQNLKLPKLMEIATLEGILACVRSGLCSTVMPQSVISTFKLEPVVRQFPVANGKAQVTITLVHRSELNRDPRIKELRSVFLNPPILANNRGN